MADSKTAGQLLSGFYGVEANAWRWTARRFVITFPAPANGGTKGARLELHLFIPGGHIDALGPVTLSADIDEYQMKPETFSAEGQYTYARDIPPEALRSNIIPVIFSFDKALKGNASESRELGAVVSMAALLPK